MTEKQGNTTQSNHNYIHTVTNITKKKYVKAKSRRSRKLRKGAIFKERKSQTIDHATRQNDPRHPSLFFVIKLKHGRMTPSFSISRAPIQLEDGITLLPKTAIHTLCHPVLLDIMVGVVAR